jgi:uncharacterized membrane protein
MWTRSNLKNLAKSHLAGRYWMAFLVTVVVALLSGGYNFFSWRFDSNFNVNWNDITSGNFPKFIQDLSKGFGPGMLAAAIAGTVFVGGLIGLAYSILVSPVLQVGGNRWFSRNREAEAIPQFGQVFSLFKAGAYLKTVGSMLWMNLFLLLWSLLAVIPFVIGWLLLFFQFFGMSIFWRTGNIYDWLTKEMIIILPLIFIVILASVALSIPVYVKMYSYKMTPWILADNPAIGYKRALNLSMELTRGHKWNMFVLDLSFLGWAILGLLACGIGIIFLAPYYQAVQAELYATLRQEGVDRGSTSMEELGYIKVTQPAS